MAGAEEKWSSNAEDYKLVEIVGKGGSAKVYHAQCTPVNKECAVKVSAIVVFGV